MIIDEKQLKEFLLDSGLVMEADYEKAVEEVLKSKNKLTVCQALINSGQISENDFHRAEAYVLGIPFVSLKDQKIDFNILSLIPEPVARKNNIVAFRREGHSLEVAMLDIKSLSTVDFIKNKIGFKVLPRLTDSDSLKSALLQYQKYLRVEYGNIIQKDATALKKMMESWAESNTGEDLQVMAQDLLVTRILYTLLKHAILQNVSDVHLEVLENDLLVRYRIDGGLYEAMVLPKSVSLGLTARIKALANLNLEESSAPQNGNFQIADISNDFSFQAYTMPTYFGEKVIIRILLDNNTGFTLESMGFHGENLEILNESIKNKKGIILTSGPADSGKTATLYTLLDMLNTPNVNICTIEDAVEYPLTRVNQTQVKPEIGFTLINGLRSILRQDPDVIMVGEIRDSETASLSFNAALTNHLFLSSLTTDSAVAVINKLQDLNIDPLTAISTVKIIINQRLIKGLAPTKTKYFLSKTEIASLSKVVDLKKILNLLKKEKIVGEKATIESIPFYRPKVESKDGYEGRVCVNEVLKLTPTIKELILHGESSEKITEQAKKEGMITIIEDGIFKAAQGLTSIEEVMEEILE